MRIAIDVRKIEPTLSGIGRYTKNILTHLSRLDRDNEYVLVGNRDLHRSLAPGKNFRTVIVDYPAFSLRSLFLMHKILRREKIDLFHSPFISAPLFAPCKTVITVHDLIPLRFARGFEGNRGLAPVLKRRVFGLILSLVTRKASRIITVSRASKEALQRFDGSLASKTDVIYEAPETIFRKVSDEEIKRSKARFGLKGKSILHVGIIRPHKNLIRLFEALELLVLVKRQPCTLAIVGGQEEERLFLKAKAQELGISRYVLFAGGLTDDEIVPLMNAVDAFVFPSLEEGFGLPPLEAMACGTPVITSNLSSLPEVVGEAALLVDPRNVQELADAIDRLLTDERLKNQLIRKGFERIRFFSWEKTAQETLQVYRNAVNGKQQV
ncbi:MAG: glycosyltransferase family 1 protein [Candidatus Zixiibacteriota bacterium]